MKMFSSILLSFLLIGVWGTDFESAKKKALKENKLVLMSFSGSDWCGPCIQMHKEIFENKAFTNYADENLVLVNVDFPRLLKLSPSQEKKNQVLADKYDPEGVFPVTLLMTAEGTVLKKWIGYPRLNAQQFTDLIKPFKTSRNK